eukprot:Pompholyxophrys_punicea_v1_NODE_559_length_1691_cov_2.544010.p1 type:complete len:116 gc:universal NODE_559_length_1691_cov_2.544010:586-239(-)
MHGFALEKSKNVLILLQGKRTEKILSQYRSFGVIQLGPHCEPTANHCNCKPLQTAISSKQASKGSISFCLTEIHPSKIYIVKTKVCLDIVAKARALSVGVRFSRSVSSFFFFLFF